ncbi:hypothetical protein CDAR_405391 [Caerostris darwini]|uniref:Uncharacterized protein n=1 Tax=Caerostris darwini TaxID=1538125 RepID=A0AAV4WGN0_9ARAC|nr:hypothetical protein CDAR_405391 [Caerostris darwini]
MNFTCLHFLKKRFCLPPPPTPLCSSKINRIDLGKQKSNRIFLDENKRRFSGNFCAGDGLLVLFSRSFFFPCSNPISMTGDKFDFTNEALLASKKGGYDSKSKFAEWAFFSY